MTSRSVGDQPLSCPKSGSWWNAHRSLLPISTLGGMAVGAAVQLPARCLFSLRLGRKSSPRFFCSAVAHTQLWREVERRQGRTSEQSLWAAEDLWPQSFCKDNNCVGLLEGVEEEKLPKKGSVAARPPLLGAFQKAGAWGDSSCQEQVRNKRVCL